MRTVARVSLAALGALTLVTPVAVGAQDWADAPVDVVGYADYDWRLTTLAGQPVSLSDYRGEVIVINVWATWCAPCVREIESFARLSDALGDAPVTILLVSPERAEPVRRFARRYRYDQPFLLESAPMPAAFDLRALPTTYVIDRDGRIVLKQRGAADWGATAVVRYLLSLTAR
jgi:thiol-disulfide isomerase/thioredoxin